MYIILLISLGQIFPGAATKTVRNATGDCGRKLRKVCQNAIKTRKRRGRQTLGGWREVLMIDERNFCHKRKVCMKHGALL